MSSFTPGPWIVGPTNDFPDEPDEIAILAPQRIVADGHPICVAVAVPCGATSPDRHPEITRANARLIAAVHDLKDALLDARKRLDGAGMLGGDSDPIDVALAKAGV